MEISIKDNNIKILSIGNAKKYTFNITTNASLRGKGDGQDKIVKIEKRTFFVDKDNQTVFEKKEIKGVCTILVEGNIDINIEEEYRKDKQFYEKIIGEFAMIIYEKYEEGFTFSAMVDNMGAYPLYSNDNMISTKDIGPRFKPSSILTINDLGIKSSFALTKYYMPKVSIKNYDLSSAPAYAGRIHPKSPANLVGSNGALLISPSREGDKPLKQIFDEMLSDNIYLRLKKYDQSKLVHVIERDNEFVKPICDTIKQLGYEYKMIKKEEIKTGNIIFSSVELFMDCKTNADALKKYTSKNNLCGYAASYPLLDRNIIEFILSVPIDRRKEIIATHS